LRGVTVTTTHPPTITVSAKNNVNRYASIAQLVMFTLGEHQETHLTVVSVRKVLPLIMELFHHMMMDNAIQFLGNKWLLEIGPATPWEEMKLAGKESQKHLRN